jgi:hypothetical protein
MTSFCFEHVFRASSTTAVFAAYFAELGEREVLELEDNGEVLRRTCKVVSRRKLPALVRPLTSGDLHYIERVEWRRSDDTMTIEVRPSLLRGRVQIVGTYTLEPVGPQAIRRRYAGDVSVDIAVLSGRIERGIVAELAKELPISAAGTQDWLDRT